MKYRNMKLAIVFVLSTTTLALTACGGGSSSPSASGGCGSDIDSDGDGLNDCFEMENSLTLPNLADTDGDGRDDGYEYDRFDASTSIVKFNPRIADMPQVKVELVSMPRIQLDFEASDSTTSSVVTQFEQSETQSIDLTNSNAISSQVTATHAINGSLMVGAGVQIGVVGGPEFTTELTAGFTEENSESSGSEISWSQSQQTEKSLRYAESQETSRTVGTTYTGGNIQNIGIQISNTGHVAYKIEHLELAVQSINPLHPTSIEHIGRLNTAGLAADLPGGAKSGALSFNLEKGLSLSTAQQLLQSADKLVIKSGSHVLKDINDQSILLRYDDVDALTATITIDYGANTGLTNNYRVAVQQIDESKSISVHDALTQILQLDFEQGQGEWNYPDTGIAATGQGLLRIGNSSHNSTSNQYWQLAHYHAPNGVDGDKAPDLMNVVLDDYDLKSMQLSAGDKLVLVYVGDQDRDGINDRTEKELGTDVNNADSDEDGLSDALELYGWYSNLRGDINNCSSSPSYRVTSNPLNPDSDGDAKTDKEEYDSCDNPQGSFIALAGDDQLVAKSASVTLNGDAGTFGQNLNLDYEWRLQNGVKVKNSDNDLTSILSGKTPKLTANDLVESLVFDLVITDLNNTENTSTDQVIINVLKDPANAVFVGAPHTDGTESGSISHPYDNIAATVAANPGKDFYVMANKTRILQSTLTVPDGSSLFGGYDTSWVRDVSSTATRSRIRYFNKGVRQPVLKYNTISGSSWLSGFNLYSHSNVSLDNPVVPSFIDETSPGNGVLTPESAASVSNLDRVAVLVQKSTLEGNLTIRDNYIYTQSVDNVAQPLPGSSYGVYIANLATLSFINNYINSGNGGNTSERVAPDGNEGAEGKGASTTITIDGTTYGPNDYPVYGGDGGNTQDGAIENDGGDGGNAERGGYDAEVTNGVCGLRGKKGETITTNHQDGYPGNAGCDGSNGSFHGTGSIINLGNVINSFDYGFISALNGTAGANGTDGTGGGGGGGGAYCLFCSIGGGGGGGEGGEGGRDAFAAFGGGASIGLWLNHVTSSIITNNTINTFTGGYGGLGGYSLGGEGGNGGARGVATNSGGNGGKGGKGGNSGRGGGGGGGPSIGIFIANSVGITDWSANTVNAGNAGAGGCAGCASANGATGASLGVYDADASDGTINDTTFGWLNTITRGTNGWIDQPDLP